MKRRFLPARAQLVLLCICACAFAAIFACGCAPAPAAAPETAVFVAPAHTEAPRYTVPPTPTPTATPVPTPTPAPTATPVPTPFSFVWFSDTQTMTWAKPEALTSMGEWVRDNAEARNIVYAFHTGDMVDSGASEEQWKSFQLLTDAMGGVVPFQPTLGNHDYRRPDRDLTNYYSMPFLTAFDDAHRYDGGRGLYALFSAGGVDFIFLSVPYFIDEACFAWANELLAANRDRVALIVAHSYLNREGVAAYEGWAIKRDLVEKNPNVRLLICGHCRATALGEKRFDDDGDGVPERHFVAQMYNFQGTEIHFGYLRVLTFDPMSRSIEVYTYSPFLDKLYRDEWKHTQVWTIEDAF